MKLFAQLLKALGEFMPENPMMAEWILEEKMRHFLLDRGFSVESQVSKKGDRYDLICKNGMEIVCIELKIKATISDVEQFDRYMPKFRDGFIIVCWNATDSLRDVFDNVIEQTPTPIALMELCMKYSMV